MEDEIGGREELRKKMGGGPGGLRGDESSLVR